MKQTLLLVAENGRRTQKEQKLGRIVVIALWWEQASRIPNSELLDDLMPLKKWNSPGNDTKR
jgi:hypothetical protein